MDQRPIDRKRTSGGGFNVGTADDGAILRMETIKDRLFVIKEKSIYEVISADKIDPQRTNFDLPPFTHKLIANQGTDSELVSKTFLTAQTLFKQMFFDKSIDTDKVILLTLELLQQLSALNSEINNYLQKEREEDAKYQEMRISRASHAIPAIIDIGPRCTTIAQKANHVEQSLIEIILVFYPDAMSKNAHFSTFYNYVISLYGSEDDFAKFLEGTLYFMQVMRELRNALDHRLTTVKILNYELQQDSSILAPTIELNHRGAHLPKMSLSHFFEQIIPNMLFLVENTFAYLASKKCIPGGLQHEVREIPEQERRNKYMKYSFWSGVLPGGFYYQ